MISINRSSPIPLYYQVAQTLRDQILAGLFAPGSEIPSERELQQDYQVSRYTVRQAIDLLVSEGLVRREQGRGSYVLPEGLVVRSRIDTFFEHRAMLGEFGYATTVQHISTERLVPDETIRDGLDLDKGDKVIRFTKLFLANGEPAILAMDHIPVKSIKKDYDETGAGGDFFRFVEEVVGRRIEYLLSDIIPLAASSDMARIFRVPEGTPLLLLQEVFLDVTQQTPIQFSYNYHNPDLIHYSIVRKRRQP